MMSVAATDLVLNRPENIDAVDQYGKTELIRASRRGDTSAVVDLIAEGANVNAVDNDGITALMMASGNSYPETARALIAGRANINLVSRSGDNALSLARQKINHSPIQTLFFARFDRNRYTTFHVIEGGLKELQYICKKRDAAVIDGLPLCMRQPWAGIIQGYDCDLTFDDFPPTSEFVRKSIKEDSTKQAKSRLSFSAMVKTAVIAAIALIAKGATNINLVNRSSDNALSLVGQNTANVPVIENGLEELQGICQKEDAAVLDGLPAWSSSSSSYRSPLFFSNTTTTATTTVAPAVPTDREQQSPALVKRG